MNGARQASMPRRRWGSGRGTLIALAGLLVISGILRIGGSTGAAIALEVKERADAMLAGSEAMSDETNPIVDVTPELLELLEMAKAKEQALNEREAQLQARAQALALVESAIQDDILRLEQAEAELRATMASADKAAETDIGRLTNVYENMKPDQAAALFQLMEPSFAAGFLGRMRPDAAAAIMAGLSPDLAYTISVVLAGRNANVPREPVPEPMQEMPKQ